MIPEDGYMGHALPRGQAKPPPVGSRWYLFGRHWTVTGHGERDGRVTAIMRPDRPTTAHGKRGIPITLRCLERRGTQTDGEED